MEFGIQEDASQTLNFNDILYKMTQWQAIECKHVIKINLWQSVPF